MPAMDTTSSKVSNWRCMTSSPLRDATGAILTAEAAPRPCAWSSTRVVMQRERCCPPGNSSLPPGSLDQIGMGVRALSAVLMLGANGLITNQLFPRI